MKYTKYYETENFDPSKLEFVEWFDNGLPSNIIDLDLQESAGLIHPPEIILEGEGLLTHTGKCRELLDEQGYGNFNYDGKCQHCGTRLRYCNIYKNIENGELIVVGETCATERLSLTLSQFKIRRAQSKTQAQETRIWRAQQYSTWIAEDATRAGLVSYLEENDRDDFYYSLLRYFRKNGRLSEAQEKALRKSIKKQKEYTEAEAERVANAKPAPKGRVTIKGRVLGTKVKDTMWDSILKMTVEAEEGYRVWGTVPNSIYFDVRKGDIVEFTATVEPSETDNLFGFFKRPTKAQILEKAQTEESNE